jgi:phosphonate degradation associated HDIG domain protein
MTAPDPAALSPDTIVPFLADILLRRGAEAYIGEPVTISEHMLQCADLAERSGAPDEIIAAALLHDIGHFTSEFAPDAAGDGIDNLHEEAGARVIERFFPAVIVDCVRHHVAAKRYLCATDPDYLARLSDASVLSLKLQGGPMSAAEVAAFEQNPHLDAILQVRRWDDTGKDTARKAPPFEHFQPVLNRVVLRPT